MRINGMLKKIVSVLPDTIQRDIIWYNNRLTRNTKVKKWELTGCPLPPPHQYKQLIIEQISKRRELKCFIETGTFLGHMIEAQRNNFLQLYSIEVEHTLFFNAKKYFEPYKHIEIVEGDSAVKLQLILAELSETSILFWLDGHYSGENTGMADIQCPIYNELIAIFNKCINHKYIMIDDARCFDGTNDYPTIEELRDFISGKESGLKMEIVNDIIHIY